MVSRSIEQAFYGLNERSVRLLISYHCIVSIFVIFLWPSDICTSKRFPCVWFTLGSVHLATFPSIGIRSKSDNGASDDFLMHASLIYQDYARSSVSRAVLALDAHRSVVDANDAFVHWSIESTADHNRGLTRRYHSTPYRFHSFDWRRCDRLYSGRDHSVRRTRRLWQWRSRRDCWARSSRQCRGRAIDRNWAVRFSNEVGVDPRNTRVCHALKHDHSSDHERCVDPDRLHEDFLSLVRRDPSVQWYLNRV